MDEALASQRVAIILSPLPKAGGAVSAVQAGHAAGGQEPSARGLKRRAAKERKKEEAKVRKSAEAGGKGASPAAQQAKGGGKGDKRGGPAMPLALRGMSARTHEGQPICFDAQLPHGCAKAACGERCSKGWHLCCVPGCPKGAVGCAEPHCLPGHSS